MNKDLECSFCFKTRDEVQVLVKSVNKELPVVYICDECVADAKIMMKELPEGDDLVS